MNLESNNTQHFPLIPDVKHDTAIRLADELRRQLGQIGEIDIINEPEHLTLTTVNPDPLVRASIAEILLEEGASEAIKTVF